MVSVVVEMAIQISPGILSFSCGIYSERREYSGHERKRKRKKLRDLAAKNSNEMALVFRQALS